MMSRANQDEDADGSYKAQLLARNGEDIVVMLLRQVEILLAAAAEAEAQQAAGADGILRLQHLQALVERVVLRVQPCADASAGVALRQKINGNEQAAQNNKTDQILPVRTAERHEDKAECQNDERRRHVRFEVEQHGDDAEDHDIGRHAVADRLHIPRVRRHNGRKRADDAEFCNLGRLEAHEAEVEPARRAAALRADERHEDQQADGRSQDQERQLLIPFIWHAADEPHHTDAHHGKDELIHED